MPRRKTEDVEGTVLEADKPAKPVKRVKHPVPEGFETLSEFALRTTHEGLTNSEAQVYNLAKFANDTPVIDKETGEPKLDDNGEPVMKSGNGFPLTVHTDNRAIVHKESGLEFLRTYKENRSVRRAAAREAQAKRNAGMVLGVARYVRGMAQNYTPAAS